MEERGPRQLQTRGRTRSTFSTQSKVERVSAGIEVPDGMRKSRDPASAVACWTESRVRRLIRRSKPFSSHGEAGQTRRRVKPLGAAHQGDHPMPPGIGAIGATREARFLASRRSGRR